MSSRYGSDRVFVPSSLLSAILCLSFLPRGHLGSGRSFVPGLNNIQKLQWNQAEGWFCSERPSPGGQGQGPADSGLRGSRGAREPGRTMTSSPARQGGGSQPVPVLPIASAMLSGTFQSHRTGLEGAHGQNAVGAPERSTFRCLGLRHGRRHGSRRVLVILGRAEGFTQSLGSRRLPGGSPTGATLRRVHQRGRWGIRRSRDDPPSLQSILQGRAWKERGTGTNGISRAASRCLSVSPALPSALKLSSSTSP